MEIKENLELGRFCISTKNYKIGDLIFEESPFLVSDSSSLKDIYETYKKIDKNKKIFLDTFFYPKDRKINEKDVTQFWNLYEPEDIKIEELNKIYLIYKFNSNQYLYNKEVKCALFPTISKIAHSCTPNSALNTKNSSKGKLFAIKDINVGEIVTISYLPVFYFISSTKIRREYIKLNYEFICHCLRCDSLDKYSGIYCYSCEGIIYNNGKNKKYWICSGTCKKEYNEEQIQNILSPVIDIENQVLTLEKQASTSFIINERKLNDLISNILVKKLYKTKHWTSYWLDILSTQLIKGYMEFNIKSYLNNNLFKKIISENIYFDYNPLIIVTILDSFIDICLKDKKQLNLNYIWLKEYCSKNLNYIIISFGINSSEVKNINYIIKNDKNNLKIGVNQKCPCGSDKKYKKCCKNLFI